MNNEIFEKEQSHLSETYDKLLKKKEELEASIAALDEKAIDDKNDIRDNLQEELAHSGVDGIADEVGVQGLEDGLAGQDLRSHSGRVSHT